MKENNVILVNESDQKIGVCDKLEAHKKGLLHRAISVFVFNSKGEFLLQQRAKEKYHTPELWSNTCCSHPFEGESELDAANRRLMEEMGLEAELKYIFKFNYKTTFSNKLIENEIDHVFIGISNELPNPNKQEVQDYKYVSYNNVTKLIEKYPDSFTFWFKNIYKKVFNYYSL